MQIPSNAVRFAKNPLAKDGDADQFHDSPDG